MKNEIKNGISLRKKLWEVDFYCRLSFSANRRMKYEEFQEWKTTFLNSTQKEEKYLWWNVDVVIKSVIWLLQVTEKPI
jgi:hypothetical protein